MHRMAMAAARGGRWGAVIREKGQGARALPQTHHRNKGRADAATAAEMLLSGEGECTVGDGLLTPPAEPRAALVAYMMAGGFRRSPGELTTSSTLMQGTRATTTGNHNLGIG